MEVTIVQHGKEVVQEVMEKVSEEVAKVKFNVKRADDPIDSLAYAKKGSEESDYVMLFVEIPEDKDYLRNSFYNGLAFLEATTGKTILKEIYTDLEEPDVDEVVKKFIESAF